MVRQNLPDAPDLRTTGEVNPIRDQKPLLCESSWAFAAMAVLSSCYFRKYGQQYIGSEQHLVGCANDDSVDNDGCYGGSTTQALKYINATFMTSMYHIVHVSSKNTHL